MASSDTAAHDVRAPQEKSSAGKGQVMITGTSSGIGRALAKQMVNDGWKVWGVARREAPLRELQQELGESFSFSVADASAPADVARVVREMDVAKFTPDTVVLNAGIYPHDTDNGFASEVAREVISVNVNSALNFVGVLLPRFLSRGRGQFVAVSSLFGVRPDPRGVGYAASKAALSMAFRSLHVCYHRSPVRFKVMYFGPITTEKYFPPSRPHSALAARSPQQAALAIRRLIAGRRVRVIYPGLVGWAFRLSAWLPDLAFETLSKPFKR
ncbi:MAG: SDR family NAD(P)-dependent oxidoreductase [Patescibacteria group bacterium]|nr:SDR family NAD(P)-dependent oxidoreductase [Patescibacteria group bacterium]